MLLLIQPLSSLLSNYITFKFHISIEIIFYLKIPILANSKTTDLQPNFGTCKFHYLQIPLLANSYNPRKPVCEFLCVNNSNLYPIIIDPFPKYRGLLVKY